MPKKYCFHLWPLTVICQWSKRENFLAPCQTEEPLLPSGFSIRPQHSAINSLNFYDLSDLVTGIRNELKRNSQSSLWWSHFISKFSKFMCFPISSIMQHKMTYRIKSTKNRVTKQTKQNRLTHKYYLIKVKPEQQTQNKYLIPHQSIITKVTFLS